MTRSVDVTMKYLILLFMFVVNGSHGSGYDPRTEELKGSLRKGFVTTCIPTVTSQIERASLLDQISQTQIMLYCVCVAIKIYDDLTSQEIEQTLTRNELPNRKKLARKTYSEECADSEW